MKINRELLRKYRRMDKKSWHDQGWWDFMRSPEVAAIETALGIGDPFRDDTTEAGIIKIAKIVYRGI